MYILDILYILYFYLSLERVLLTEYHHSETLTQHRLWLPQHFGSAALFSRALRSCRALCSSARQAAESNDGGGTFSAPGLRRLRAKAPAPIMVY